MAEPYHLTIRFRQQGARALLDLESDSGAGTHAAMDLPFGDDLPLVLRALDAAQITDPQASLTRLSPAEHERLTTMCLHNQASPAANFHALVGRALLRALTADPQARAVLTQARAEARAEGRSLELVLRFPREASLLADIPWELLWDEPEHGSGLPLLLAQGGHSSCVRYLTLPRPLPPPAPPGQRLSILAVTPRAGISPELYRRQRAALAVALKAGVEAGVVQLVQPSAPLTAGGLLDLVRQHRPDVLSFFGHGELQDGQGHLLLDDEHGGEELVAAGRLAGLADAGLRLVLLHACRGDQPGSGLLSSTAGLLSALGLPAVIAMQTYIRVGAAARLQAVLCQGLILDGLSGWRMPERMELETLVDVRAANPAIDTNAFPDTPSDKFWTATDSYWMGSAWIVYFGDGSSVPGSKDSNLCYVRCVR
ncbi:MAG: DUF1566 domain-containing protein [Chloroflexales bacterium]|nr:DUF1566 domain-containing protein [Chloroflexales bacterium]